MLPSVRDARMAEETDTAIAEAAGACPSRWYRVHARGMPGTGQDDQTQPTPADDRERRADDREAIADQRDRVADQRERRADER